MSQELAWLLRWFLQSVSIALVVLLALRYYEMTYGSAAFAAWIGGG